MRRRWFVRIFGVAALVAIVFAGFGYAVLALWNWLMPGIFGLPELTFWKAIGLLALSWIFFGSWRGLHRPGRHWRGGMHRRWEHMSPEQRAEFRKAMENCWGRRSDSSAADSTV